ncbi:MAG TPA: hypothetical protein VMV03_16945 [Spirochaetia bacterium]|nr:hypothetical protein [Spirochaetia bacterium]
MVASEKRKFTPSTVLFLLALVVYVGNVLGILFTVILNSASSSSSCL